MERPAMVLAGRVHPGESQGSFMVMGALEFLAGDSEDARELRRKYKIYVIPMMNPDGVINGNYRCRSQQGNLNAD
jgi:murein tripeptide amidase MpaA